MQTPSLEPPLPASLHACVHRGTREIGGLKRLVEAVQPRALVPVHTFAGDHFAEHFGASVVRRADGEWWEV